MNIGDKAHFWNRRYGRKPWCNRVIIREISADKKSARVRVVSPFTGLPVVSIETSRLKEGWNDWKDEMGRPI